MTQNAISAGNRNELFSSLSETFKSIERVDDSLIAAKVNKARWTGVLIGGVVFFVWGFGMELITSAFLSLATFSRYAIYLVVATYALPLVSGFVAYYLAKKRYIREFVDWKNSLWTLQKSVAENKQDANVIERTLQLMDKISDWLPSLPDYKGDEALGYGVGAFVLVTILGWALSGFTRSLVLFALGLLVAVIVGAMVWLYFRHEKRKEAEEQVREFRAWKQRFEEGKDAFLKSI